MEIIVIQALFKLKNFFKVFGEFGTSDVLKPPLLELKIYAEPKKKPTPNLFVWTRVSCKDSKSSSLLGLSGGWLQFLEFCMETKCHWVQTD